jgi:hypothetical protein
VLAADPELPDEWVTILQLAGIAFGLGPQADVAMLDEQVARTLIERETKSATSPFRGRSIDEVLAELEPRVGPERLLDLMLRAGPYRLTLADLEAAPHGSTWRYSNRGYPMGFIPPAGMIELAPEPLVADVTRLRAALERGRANGGLVLVDRRHLRSNNSWMHNLPVLARGPERCTLHVHPDGAARLSLLAGGSAEVRSRTGALTATVEVTEDIMPGVVSLPHGWGHDVPGTELRVAAERRGANSNLLSDELLLDAVSGNAVLNGIPVEVAPVGAPAEPALSTA